MKKYLLKIIIAALVVFFSLPLIFNTDAEKVQAVKASGAQASSEAKPDMLPIVSSKALPLQANNVLARYASKLKRFYIGSSKDKQQIRQEILQSENGKAANPDGGVLYASSNVRNSPDVSGYQTASSGGEANGSYSAANFSAPAAIPYGAAATKQLINDDAPVKGLYESSATDSYESRFNADKVYSGVMNKVDRLTAKVPVLGGGKISLTPSLSVSPSETYASSSFARANQGYSAGSDSKVFAKTGGRGSSYGGGRIISPSSLSGSSNGNFENQVYETGVKTSAASGEHLVRQYVGGVSGSYGANGAAAYGGAGQVGPQISQPGNTYINAPGLNNLNGNNKPQEEKDTFNPDKWTLKYTQAKFCSISDDDAGPMPVAAAKTASGQTENTSAPSAGGASGKPKEEGSSKPDKDRERLEPSCLIGSKSLPSINQKILDKYKLVFVMGTQKGKYVVPGKNSFTGYVFDQDYAAKYYSPSGTKLADTDYYLVPKAELNKVMRQKDAIVITSDNNIEGVHIKSGDTEYWDGIKKIAKDLNNYEVNKVAREKAKKANELAQQKSDKKVLKENLDKYKKQNEAKK